MPTARSQMRRLTTRLFPARLLPTGRWPLVPASRWPLALALILGLFVSALGQPAPARADPPDPAARLQLIVHGFHINDDEALFGGRDFPWIASITSLGDGQTDSITGSDLPFHASTGDNITLDRLIPLHRTE